MAKEFNLKRERNRIKDILLECPKSIDMRVVEIIINIIEEQDKLFIKLLKGIDMGEFLTAEGIFLDGMFHEEIDKLAGDELSK